MSENPDQGPNVHEQDDADEAQFRAFMRQRFRVDVPAPPAAPAPPSPPAMPDLHAGPRAAPSPDIDHKLEAYVRHFWPQSVRPAD